MRLVKKEVPLKRYHASAGDIISDKSPLVNGVLREEEIACRPAFISKPEAPIYYDDGIEFDENYPVDTGCSVYYLGRFGRVIINVRDNLMGNFVFDMRLVYTEGDSLSLGQIAFSRSNSGVMGYPEAYTVFSGKPIKGCGIFFTCHLTYGGLSEDVYQIMELSSDRTVWKLINDDDVYIPTLLANGRGEAWFRAAPYGELLDLPDPIVPQSRNILSAGFYSYFTTDSTSLWYALPESGLDDAAIHGEYTYMGTVYTFTIEAGKTTSAGVTIDGNTIVMVASRIRGEFWFRNEAGNGFPLPFGGKQNNLKITAFKTHPEDIKKLCSMSKSTAISSSVSRGENDVVLLYGSRFYPSEMIWNSPLNPTYFPAENHLSLGDSEVALENITLKDRTIFAFKENRMFLSETLPFEGDGKIFSEDGIAKNISDYKITVKKVVNTHSSPLPQSIQLFGEDIFYSDGSDIYRFKTVGNGFEKLFSVSGEGEAVFATADKERYCLFFEKGAIVCERDEKRRFVFYRWNFEENILGGFSYLGKTLLFGLIRKEVEAMLFPVVMEEGGKDRKAVLKDGTITFEDIPISSEVELIPQFSPIRKRFYKIFVEGSGEVDLSVFEENKKLKSERVSLKRGGGLCLCGFVAKRPRVRLGFKDDFHIRSLSVDYRVQNLL